MKREQNYLLTTDIALTAPTFEISGLSVEPSLFHELDQRLIKRLDKIVANLEVIDFASIRINVQAKVNEALAKFPEAIVVATNPLLCDWPNCQKTRKHCCIEINRLIDLDGNDLDIGPRPWHSSIDNQLGKLAKFLDGKPIILIEDGSWSGKTLIKILNLCKKHDIEVSTVICGILFEEGLQKIESSGFENLVDFIHYQDNCKDWMPDHDLLATFPSTGKVIGEKGHDGLFSPLRIGDRMSLSTPYIRPYGDTHKWASIPEEKVADFSVECLSDTIEFFQTVEEHSGHSVTVSTIASFYPRASIPHLAGQKLRFHSPLDRIVKILSDDYDTLRREINGR